MLSYDAPGGLIISVLELSRFALTMLKLFFEFAKLISSRPKGDDSPIQVRLQIPVSDHSWSRLQWLAGCWEPWGRQDVVELTLRRHSQAVTLGSYNVACYHRSPTTGHRPRRSAPYR